MSAAPVFLHNKEAECILSVVCCESSNGHTILTGHQIPEGYEVMDPAKSEGAGEKHIPVIEVNGRDVTVKVGSIYHPMTEEHGIGWVCLHTENGCQFVHLCQDMDCANAEPVAHFSLVDGDKVIAAYAYCNLHGLWKCEI